MKPRLHAVCDDDGKLLVTLLTEGQMRGRKGAKLMLGTLPSAEAPPGDFSNRRECRVFSPICVAATVAFRL
ncbi:MAG TPA: hypothetical protein P5341_03575 [Hyphomonas sp.]|nr:hypothetical protein [Hyphomonas sp.]